MQKIFDIAIPNNVEMLFTYKCIVEEADRNFIGRRVLVPFGKSNKLITGFIINENNEISNDSELKYVQSILDESPSFSPTLLEFCKWMSSYYICSLGEVLRAALPGSMTVEESIKIKLSADLNQIDLNSLKLKSPKRFELLNLLASHKNFVTLKFIESKLKYKITKIQLNSLVEQGLIEVSNELSEEIAQKFVKTVSISDELMEDEEELGSILKKLEKSSQKQYKLLLAIYSLMKERKKSILVTEILQRVQGSISVLNTLKKKELIKFEEVEINRYFIDEENMLAKKDESKLSLTIEQENALTKINSAIDDGKYKTFLLFGVTGSGKTLVYINAIKKILLQNKTAMLLVPEIALTPQLIDRFNIVFPGEIAVLHSKMSDGERQDEWRSIKTGRKKIVIGARSGIFAPLENLGLIIVDEEHENSYKQESPDPRYNGRDAAVIRGMIENAVVVLGSATPSVESLYNANAGKYELLEIKNRADGANLPKIKIIDMVDARKQGQIINSFSKELLDKIVDRMHKKEAVILFRNRRGFSNYLQCSDCATVPECVNCSIKLTYHKNTNSLRCHLCGYSSSMIKRCSECGSENLKIIGYGTQRIEEELSEYLQSLEIEVVIDRMDLDSTKKKGEQRKILQRFSNGETDILIGTQMVAKGLDFDRVTLVGVVNADLQLYISDFRASERTFQLLTQVSGRAGRHRDFAGEVIIQTSHPSNYVFKCVGDADYENFFKSELSIRQKANYPPFAKYIFVELKGKDNAELEKLSFEYYLLLAGKKCNLIIYKPVIPSVYKTMNFYRRIIIIKSKKSKKATDELGQVLREVTSEFSKLLNASNIIVKVDIDSYSGV